jgi:hypothetical protein
MEKQMSFMPQPNEQISVWAGRFLQRFKIMPYDQHLAAPGMPWVSVTVASNSDGKEQTALLHRTLQFLAEKYPEDVAAPYVWTGKSVFWFTDYDEAVVFKLALPNI